MYPPVTSEDQASIYGDQYFERDGDWVCGIFGARYVDAEAKLRAEAQHILAMLPTNHGALLDIGCAGGVFLDEARTRGFTVAGIELNANMAGHARERYRLDVRQGRIEDMPADTWTEVFDVVTLLDCLEHIPAPLDALRKVRRWLRPGGYVFIRGPLGNSTIGRLKEHLRRVFGVTKQLPGYPLDANVFNPQSLTTLLQTAGFERPVWRDMTSTFANAVAQTAPSA